MIRRVAATAGLLWWVGSGVAAAQQRVDLLVKGGSVYDGSGGPPRVVDVGISGDRITLVGDGTGVKATRVVDARGLIVAPGFIDPHTHTEGDFRAAGRRGLPGFLLQGVTTVVTGNDGGGSFAVADVLHRLETDGIGVNVAYLVGHGAVRGKVLGMAARAPTAAELDSMRALVGRAMREGAFGLSTGLYYAPGSYAATEEVIELARVAAASHGYYDSHLRDESSYTVGLLGAVDEAIRIGRETGIPIHIAHIKALGVDVWGQSEPVIARIKAARAAGVDVTADQYPYTASGTSVGASLLPRWAEAGGRDSLRRRLADLTIRDKLVAEMTENLRRRGGAEALLLTGGRWKGKKLSEVAAATRATPIDAAIAIVAGGDAGVASFNMNDADIDRFMAQEFVVTGSDGSDGHPRKFGTFPRKLRRYALDRGVVSLSRAIQASSAQTAAIVGLTDRGTIAVGQFADLSVFDSTKIVDRSTYQAPEALPVGMALVVVNGRIAVDRGRVTGVLAGRPLRHHR